MDRKNYDTEDEILQTNRINDIQDFRYSSGHSAAKTFLILVCICLVSAGITAAVIYLKNPANRNYLKQKLFPPEEQVQTADERREPVPADLPSGYIYESGNSHIRNGRESYAKKYYRDAAAEFNEVLESDASDRDKSLALLYLGKISYDTEAWEKAVSYFKQALTYDSSNREAMKQLARTFKFTKNYTSAVQYAKDAVSKSPDDTDAMLLLGNIYFDMGRYTDAAEQYRRCVEKTPENARALFNLASALLKTDDEFSAVEYLRRAADADRYGEIAARASSSLGIIFTERGDSELAVKYLRQAVSIRPNDALNHYNLGVAYLKTGNQESAVAEFETAEKLSGKEEKMLENLGDMYSRLNRYDSSISVYKKILANSSRNVRILARIGEIYFKNGEPDKALEAYGKIVKTEPAGENARNAYLNMGNILDDLQRYDEAAEAVTKALAINSKDDSALYNLGIIYRHSGKPELAVEAWKKASELNTVSPAPKLAVADCYYEQGFFDLAEKEYRDILDQWPDIQEGHFKMGSLYYKQNQPGYAYKAFERAAKINVNSELARKSYINMAVINSELRPDEKGIDESVELIQKALLLKPGDPEALLSFGVLLVKKGQQDRAVDTFYQVIKNTTDSSFTAKAYNNIGKTYFAQKNYQKALTAFSRALEENPSSEEIRMNRRAASQAYDRERSAERL